MFPPSLDHATMRGKGHLDLELLETCYPKERLSNRESRWLVVLSRQNTNVAKKSSLGRGANTGHVLYALHVVVGICSVGKHRTNLQPYSRCEEIGIGNLAGGYSIWGCWEHLKRAVNSLCSHQRQGIGGQKLEADARLSVAILAISAC